MATNARFIKLFLDSVITKNPEEGLVLTDVARLYNELNARRASLERAQPASFYPLIEMYCVHQDSDARIEFVNNQRRIRGFGFKSEGIRRLTAIFVRGTGATSENLETINSLFGPLLGISDQTSL